MTSYWNAGEKRLARTLRFDFGTAGGTVELDWIRIYKK